MHGYHYMLRVHADVERKMGTQKAIYWIPDNGSVIEIVDDEKHDYVT